MKTLAQWEAQGLSLSRFLSIGDEIDEDLKDYILCVLPPATWTKECIQMGEPYDHDWNGRARYLTIEKRSMGDNWVYTGIKPRTIN